MGCVISTGRKVRKNRRRQMERRPESSGVFDSHIHLVKNSHRAFEKWKQDLEDWWGLFPPHCNNKLSLAGSENVDDSLPTPPMKKTFLHFTFKGQFDIHFRQKWHNCNILTFTSSLFSLRLPLLLSSWLLLPAFCHKSQEAERRRNPTADQKMFSERCHLPEVMISDRLGGAGGD